MHCRHGASHNVITARCLPYVLDIFCAQRRHHSPAQSHHLVSRLLFLFLWCSISSFRFMHMTSCDVATIVHLRGHQRLRSTSTFRHCVAASSGMMTTPVSVSKTNKRPFMPSEFIFQPRSVVIGL